MRTLVTVFGTDKFSLSFLFRSLYFSLNGYTFVLTLRFDFLCFSVSHVTYDVSFDFVSFTKSCTCGSKLFDVFYWFSENYLMLLFSSQDKNCSMRFDSFVIDLVR